MMTDEERRILALDQAVRIEAAAAVDGAYNAGRILTVAKDFEAYLKSEVTS